MPEHAKGKPLEVWFQDEARVGQQGTLTRKWARRGTRPRAPRDTRYKWSYIFGAACPARGTAAGLILPYVNAEAMGLHLNEIAKAVAHGAHAMLIVDGAGWHGAKCLQVPDNITLVKLPPYSPELNPMENVWAYLRSNKLAISVFDTYEEILKKMCPSVELLRQRSRTNNFNHQKRLDKGQLLGRLVLCRASQRSHFGLWVLRLSRMTWISRP